MARYAREYLAELVSSGKKATIVWDYARAVKTMVKFCKEEGNISEVIKFDLLQPAKKRPPVLAVEEFKTVVASCNH